MSFPRSSSLGLLLALAALLAACPAPPRGAADSGTEAVFDSHSHRGAIDLASLERLSSRQATSSKAKFVLTEFQDDARRAVWFLEDGFYTLHDQWYWFHLLNGVALPGVEVAPVSDLRFSTVEEVNAWARGRSPLPLDLTWVEEGSRLYSPHFYELSLKAQRELGLGGVVHFPARSGREERWVFELEYSDRISHPDLVRYFQALETTLPSEVASRILWVVRSPAQQTLADEMKASQLPYWDRVIRYQDLAVPGETEVYSLGLTAGFPKIVRSGEPLAGEASSLLFLEDVPDFLPPCAGLVTAVPQTPLAHIALLARNRGIPDAYLGGVLDRPDLEQLARAGAPAIVQAVAPDQLRLQAMTWSQYNTWSQLRRAAPIALAAVDLASAPLLVDLAALPPEEVEQKRPLVGGKGVGLSSLVHALPDPRAALAAPHAPLAITVKAYLEHLEPLRPLLAAALADQAFGADEKVRFLVLEGVEDYDERYPDPASRSLRTELVAARAGDDPLAVLVAAGGVRRALRDLPVAPATLSAITAELQARFGSYAATQALRFRSSSNVEDAQGFNGAGLYDSNSGYLAPQAQPDPDERKKSVEWALKKTWASYWSAEAFEERRTALVPHLDGAMAVVAHAEFADALEAANGVLTLTLRRDGGSPLSSMVVNSQPGAESVTNPETPGALPEVVLVERASEGAAPTLQRVRASTVTTNGAPVLTDDELLRLFEAASAVAEAWLQAANAGVPAAQADRAVTLDFEHRQVFQGWPAVASGQDYPARLVLKQVRSLDPAVPPAVSALKLPAPRDVLARARRVERRSCVSPALHFSETVVFTDANRPPDLGFAERPFTATLVAVLPVGVPELGLAKGHRTDLDHTGLDSVTRPDAQGFSILATLGATAAAAAGFTELEGRASGEWRLANGAQTASGTGLQCSTTVLYSSPEDYLLSLLAGP